jgi:hypothetical protein
MAELQAQVETLEAGDQQLGKTSMNWIPPLRDGMDQSNS